jgi:hypothetical protein
MATQIKNIDGMSFNDLQNEVERGGRFVIFSYTISILVMTFKRPTDIYFLRAGESDIAHAWPYALMTLALGWWGIPWGPIYSFMSLGQAFSGKNVTAEVISSLYNQHASKVTEATVSPETLDSEDKLG